MTRIYGFIATVFGLMVLEAVLEAARQKTHAVLYLNPSAYNIGYGFYFFERFNTPYNYNFLLQLQLLNCLSFIQKFKLVMSEDFILE